MTKPIIVKKLSDHGYPYHSKHYLVAHEEADVVEKKKFPKGYEHLKHAEKHLGKHELMGTNKKSGKIEVEKKFKKYSKEIGYHEAQEHKNLKRFEKTHRRR
jgi:hypothetical protein